MQVDLAQVMKALKEARQRRSHSLEAAAREMGVSWLTVWVWEHGKQMPTVESLGKILTYIQVAQVLERKE